MPSCTINGYTVLNLSPLGNCSSLTIVGTVLIVVSMSLILQTDDLDHGRPLNVLLAIAN